MNDFVSSLQSAQTLPELPDELARQVPDMLSSMQAEGVAKRNTGGVGKIPGAVEYDLHYKCARLMMGSKITGFNQGVEETEDIDDSERLIEIMNMSLKAEAIIKTQQTTFLKDGTVVIWLEWMEPTTKSKSKDRLSLSELLDPEPASSGDDDEDSESSF